MAKRRAVVDSDDEGHSDASPASKRARADDGSSVASESPAPKKKGAKKGAAKQKAKASNADANDADEGPASRMAMDEDEYERVNMPRIREQIENQTRKTGVSHSSATLYHPTDISSRASRSAASSRAWRCTSLCATSSCLSSLARK